MFEALQKSELGKELVEYLKGVQAKACDARNWGPNDNKETAMMVSTLIQTELIDKIQVSPKKEIKNRFE